MFFIKCNKCQEEQSFNDDMKDRHIKCRFCGEDITRNKDILNRDIEEAKEDVIKYKSKEELGTRYKRLKNKSIEEIKRSMHNPGSYEHVDISYNNCIDDVLVKITFRGTNTYGAIVIGSATLRFNNKEQLIGEVDEKSTINLGLITVIGVLFLIAINVIPLETTGLWVLIMICLLIATIFCKPIRKAVGLLFIILGIIGCLSIIGLFIGIPTIIIGGILLFV